MNQLKPFLFWIVLGLVLFCEILWWVLSMPDIDLVGNKASAQKMQTTLKEEFKHLTELDRRAKNTSPLGVFDAEKADDIRRLTDDYLVTPAWKEVLDPHVQGYDKQLKAIKERLAVRSKHLHQPVAASTDKFGWYTAYQNASEEQLKKLHAAGALVLKNSSGTPKSTPHTTINNKPSLGQGPAQGQPTSPSLGTAQPAGNSGSSSDDTKEIDFANDSAVRAQAGFFTKGADLPDAGEYPVLTQRFRTMERIIKILTETTAANTVNPVVGELDAPAAAHAAIVSVTWDNSEAVIGGETGAYAAGWRLSLTLQGPLSALLATTAAIEHPHGDAVPLMVVTGGDISRKAQFTPGERKDIGSELVNARVDILVLDFTKAPSGTKPASSNTGPKSGGSKPPNFGGPGAPGGPGMPPMNFPGAPGGQSGNQAPRKPTPNQVPTDGDSQ